MNLVTNQEARQMKRAQPQLLCTQCSTYDDGEGIIGFCALHRAAPALLEAAQEYYKVTQNVQKYDEVAYEIAKRDLEAAFAQVEGRQSTEQG